MNKSNEKRLIQASGVHTVPEEFEIAALFSLVRALVHTNPYRKRSFSKTRNAPQTEGIGKRRHKAFPKLMNESFLHVRILNEHLCP